MFCFVVFFLYFLIFFFSNLFAELGGQELELPAFLPQLLDTPERILSKNGLSFTFCNVAWQWGTSRTPEALQGIVLLANSW